MPESVQSCFELSIHLSVKRTSRDLLLKIVRGKKYRKMYGQFKNNNCLSSILNLFLSVNASFSERFLEKCSTFHSNAELYKGIQTHIYFILGNLGRI